MIRYLRTLALDLRNGYRAAKRQRLMITVARERDAEYLRTRPSVFRVGTIYLVEGGFAIGPEWQFYFAEQSPAQAFSYPPTYEDLDGTKRIYGYTLPELQEMYAHRVEFNVEA